MRGDPYDWPFFVLLALIAAAMLIVAAIQAFL